jgi:hypothetical protein
MNRHRLLLITSLVMAIYAVAIIIGFFLSNYYSDLYRVYKDLALLIIAVPAAYLAYSFQRRTEYLKTLRDLWSHMISAVQNAIEYTHTSNPSEKLYSETLLELNIVIDQVRGVFKNADEKNGSIGLYPFEPLKGIRKEIKNLGWEDVSFDRKRDTRRKIINQWKELRYSFLREFDRDFATYPSSEYLSQDEV